MNSDSRVPDGFVRFADMNEAQKRYYAREQARAYHPDNEALAILRAEWIYANHEEARIEQSLPAEKAARSQSAALDQAQEVTKVAWRKYVAAKHGAKYDAETGYRPWLNVVWPLATTDGSRSDLAGVKAK